MRYFVTILLLQSSRWGRERELVALLCLSHECCVALPHDVMGLFAVCDCGISLSFSLTFLEVIMGNYLQGTEGLSNNYFFKYAH